MTKYSQYSNIIFGTTLPAVPVYVSSAIADATPTILEMTYNLTLANIVPATSAFAVLVNSVTRTVNSVAIVAGKPQLTLASAIVYGDVVTVAYTKPGSNPLQTAAGGQAASLSAQSVTNNIVGIGFKTEWVVSGDATARTITLPLVQSRTEGALAYDFIAYWGHDGQSSHITSYNDAARIHTFPANGTYDVNIVGTMEGWSFNNAGDKLKITQVINWGNVGVFNGFKYLLGGFYGCTNLTSLGTGKILASGTGVLTQGFAQTFSNTRFSTITSGLFDNHTNVTTSAFNNTFNNNSVLTTIPAHLFDLHTAVTTAAFYGTFFQCAALTAIPTDLFKYNINASSGGAFQQTFRGCPLITTIPTDLFRYNTLVTTNAFYDTFQNDIGITAIPTDLFRYNTLASTNAFEGTFIGNFALTHLPQDIFKYNTAVTGQGFEETFRDCRGLLDLPSELFRYNLLPNDIGFQYTFKDCFKLQLRADIWYNDGEQATRFVNTLTNFAYCFQRASFTGTQGVAPDLWNCSFPYRLEVSAAPSTPWVNGDIITGQTSGAYATVYSRYTTWIWLVGAINGTYSSGETIGVTGVPAKLKAQGAGYPQTSYYLVNTQCFNGAGNSLTSISNYADIPAGWK
jgi:hypothetical protein